MVVVVCWSEAALLLQDLDYLDHLLDLREPEHPLGELSGHEVMSPQKLKL